MIFFQLRFFQYFLKSDHENNFFFGMGKTKAQRQKEYRERLKEEDNEKFKDARERQKRNYISVKNMGRT